MLDLLLHLVQKSGAAGGILLRPEHGNLVLEVVVLAVDDIDGLPGLAVLYILVLQNVLDGVQFPAGVQLKELDVVGVENDDTGQIHKGADVGDLLLHRAGEGSVGGDEAHIADEKGGQAHGGGGQQLTPGHPGQVTSLGYPLLQVVGQQKDAAIYHNEKDSRRNKAVDFGSLTKKAYSCHSSEAVNSASRKARTVQ